MGQDNTELQVKVAKLLARPCVIEGCNSASIRVRLGTNPPWGFDPGSNGRISSEYGFLLGLEEELTERAGPRYDTGIDLTNVVAYCESHFPQQETKPSGDRRGTLRRAGPTESAHQRTLRLRAAAIAAYGGECAGCGLDDYTQLAVCLKDEVIDGSGEPVWAELGVTNWAHKWVRLEELGYPPICLIRCLSCRHNHRIEVGGLTPGQTYARSSKPQHAKSKRTTSAYRDRAIAAYGGSCEACGEIRTSHLWLVRKSGAPVLRWGGSGRKMTSKQRYKWLLGNGCPDTHRLLCQPCWKKTRVGQGGDYL